MVDDRRQGVEFGDLAAALDAHDYPADAAELVDAYGERTIEFQDGEQRFGDVLGTYAEDQTFEDGDAVAQAVLGAVQDDAVGREAYTDRGQGADDPGADDSSL